MSSKFQFKQFAIHHCPDVMKVSTDSVILGAWSHIDSGNILDVGCGTGLLSIMMAQRCKSALITGIDKYPAAVACAKFNISKTPFAERLKIIESELSEFSGQSYQHIITNPPYFNQLTKSPSGSKNSFRHAEEGFWDDFWFHCNRLLFDGGSVHIILPFDRSEQLLNGIDLYGFYISRRLYISHTADKSPVLIALQLIKGGKKDVENETLAIYHPSGVWSNAYKELCAAFYIKAK